MNAHKYVFFKPLFRVITLLPIYRETLFYTQLLGPTHTIEVFLSRLLSSVLRFHAPIWLTVLCVLYNGKWRKILFFPVDRLYKRYSKHHDLQMSSSPFDSIKLNKSSVFFSFWHLATSSTYLGPISAPFLKSKHRFFFSKAPRAGSKEMNLISIWLAMLTNHLKIPNVCAGLKTRLGNKAREHDSHHDWKGFVTAWGLSCARFLVNKRA